MKPSREIYSNTADFYHSKTTQSTFVSSVADAETGGKSRIVRLILALNCSKSP